MIIFVYLKIYVFLVQKYTLMKFIKLISGFFLIVFIALGCKKSSNPSVSNNESITPKKDLVTTASSLLDNLLSSSNNIQSAIPGSISATIPFILVNDSLPGVLGQKMSNWVYDDPNSKTPPVVKTGITIRNGYLVEEIPFILGDRAKIDSFQVTRRGFMEFDNDFLWSYEFMNNNQLHNYTLRIKKHHAPKHVSSNKYITVSFTDNGVAKSKTIQWYQNAPFYVPLVYNKGFNSYLINIPSSGVLIGSSTSYDIKHMNEYGIPAKWNSNYTEFWFTHRDSTYHYQSHRDYGLSDMYVVNNINRRHKIYQQRYEIYENLTGGSKVEIRDSTYCLYHDLMKQPAYYAYRGLGFAGITTMKIFSNKSTLPETEYTIDRGVNVVSYTPGLKVKEKIKRYDYHTKTTDTITRTVTFN